MDTNDLKRIFLLTAAVSACVTVVSLPVSADWGARYGVLSLLALTNWVALAMVLGGLAGRAPIRMAAGLAVKPILLLLLLIHARHFGVEITSLLAAVNTFFLCMFGYMAWRSQRLVPARVTNRIS